MISIITALLANKYVQYALGGLVAVVVMTVLWFKFVNWISEEQVAEAIAETTAKFEPIVKDLEMRLEAANGEITTIKATFEEELKRQKDNANAKNKLYTTAIAANKALQAKYDGLFITSRELDDSLRTIKADTGSSAAGASNRITTDELFIRYDLCERSLTRVHRATATAIGIADSAIAAVEALKN
jgi:hypothetical protein